MKIVLNIIIAKPEGIGGFNVAKNFYYKTLDDHENEWFYFVSEEFDKIVGPAKNLDDKHYYVFHTQPYLRHYYAEKKRIDEAEKEIRPDVIYSILAPSYHKFKTVEVMRCANAWTVVGGVNKYAWEVTPTKYKIRYIIKAWITRFLMRNTKYFITQSRIAKNCILRTVNTSPDNICVVSNALPEVYLQYGTTKKSHDGFNMVYASSPAIHKDYMILPKVASILVNKYGITDFTIHYTIPEHSTRLTGLMKSIDEYGVTNYFVNHGCLAQDDLAALLSRSDLGLFPSLLETFSVTLLQYMYFKLPIIASELDFNKEVAADAAIYFRPHDAEAFAEKIALLYRDPSLQEMMLINANKRLKMYSNATDKYNETVAFLIKVASIGN